MCGCVVVQLEKDGRQSTSRDVEFSEAVSAGDKSKRRDSEISVDVIVIACLLTKNCSICFVFLKSFVVGKLPYPSICVFLCLFLSLFLCPCADFSLHSLISHLPLPLRLSPSLFISLCLCLSFSFSARPLCLSLLLPPIPLSREAFDAGLISIHSGRSSTSCRS